MSIIITNPAKRSLKRHYNYYKSQVSQKLAEKLKEELVFAIESLKTHPHIGQIEEGLTSLNLGHRYIVKRHYKIIYRIENKVIYITDFFDSRQDPSKMKG